MGGCEVRVPLSDIAATALANMGYLAGEVGRAAPNSSLGNDVFGSLRARDFATKGGRRLMIVAITPRQWRGTVKALGLDDAVAALEAELGVSFGGHEAVRYQHRARLYPLFEAAFAARTEAELAPVFEAEGVCWSAYRTMAEAATDTALFGAANPGVRRGHPAQRPRLPGARPRRDPGRPRPRRADPGPPAGRRHRRGARGPAGDVERRDRPAARCGAGEGGGMSAAQPFPRLRGKAARRAQRRVADGGETAWPWTLPHLGAAPLVASLRFGPLSPEGEGEGRHDRLCRLDRPLAPADRRPRARDRAPLRRRHGRLAGRGGRVPAAGALGLLQRRSRTRHDLGPDVHPRRGLFLPPITQPRRMFASSTLRFEAPLVLGETAKLGTTIADIRDRSGRTGELVLMDVLRELTQGERSLHASPRPGRPSSTAPPARRRRRSRTRARPVRARNSSGRRARSTSSATPRLPTTATASTTTRPMPAARKATPTSWSTARSPPPAVRPRRPALPARR